MTPLIDLVEKYRSSNDPEERCSIAEELIVEVGPRLRAFIYNQVPPDRAPDVSQETLVGIAKGLHMFYGRTEGALWSWCYHVARNKVCDCLRRLASNPVIPIDPSELWEMLETGTGQGDPLTFDVQMDCEFIMELLSVVSPSCYDALWKHYVYGWDYHEIARERELSYDAVRMQIARCLKQIGRAHV